MASLCRKAWCFVIGRLISDTEGTASRVQVTSGTANAVLAFPGSASVGGGNVASLRAVEVAEVKAVVEATIPTYDFFELVQ